MPPGQETGHAVPAVPADPARGFAWSDYVDWLVADRGTLTAVAEELVARQGFAADVESAERGLRRLRKRNAGGVWGERCLRAFGLPTPVADRIRWMGHYHSRFTDLPVSLGEELLRPWLRPPTSESPARVWLLLAQANLAIRRRGDPSPHLDQAALVPNPPDAAACELALVRAYHLERRDPAAATAALDAAEAALPADGPTAPAWSPASSTSALTGSTSRGPAPPTTPRPRPCTPPSPRTGRCSRRSVAATASDGACCAWAVPTPPRSTPAPPSAPLVTSDRCACAPCP